MSPDEKMGPFGGSRVLDFTLFQAGGLATTILADLGADVVKVEKRRARPAIGASAAPMGFRWSENQIAPEHYRIGGLEPPQRALEERRTS